MLLISRGWVSWVTANEKVSWKYSGQRVLFDSETGQPEETCAFKQSISSAGMEVAFCAVGGSYLHICVEHSGIIGSDDNKMALGFQIKNDLRLDGSRVPGHGDWDLNNTA